MTKENTAIKAFKGFDASFKCRGFQYKIGETYIHEGHVEPCKSGFHACENPFDVLGYYGFNDNNRFAEVELSGKVVKESDKHAASHITVKGELDIFGLTVAFVDFTLSKIDKTKEQTVVTGKYSAAEVSGKESVAIATGYAGRARAAKGGWIVLAYRDLDDECKIKHIKSAQVGVTLGIKPDTWYVLNSKGKFEEAA